MYRYSVDNAVTYTPNDFVLFRESPFALWMERLTLENPDHGIPADISAVAPSEQTLPQDEIVLTLREEGRDVVLIDWDLDEVKRRAATLEAMREGADFIVNGMLALGPLCGNSNLLMRTSGYSDLGNYLYIPCDTQANTTHHAAFRLCFLADLLHSLQGQLPPQMLLIRGDADVVPLHTEDHIYYYRAVKKRFMDAMRNFRKHRMPDPAESAQFGRWSECASEVLKQRVLSAEYQYEEGQQEETEELQVEESAPQVAASAAQGAVALRVSGSGSGVGVVAEPLHLSTRESAAAPTLAEQASMLSPDAFKQREGPGRTPNLARFPRPVPDLVEQEPTDSCSAEVAFDDTLQNLAFIGSAEPLPAQGAEQDVAVPEGLQIAALVEATGSFEAAEPVVAALEAPELPELPADDLPEEELIGLVSLEASDPMLRDGAVAELPELLADNLPEEELIGLVPLEASDPLLREVAPPLLKESPAEQEAGSAPADAPAPTLRDVVPPEPKIEGYEVEMIDLATLQREMREPHLLPPEETPGDSNGSSQASSSDALGTPEHSAFVDLDSAPPPTLMPVATADPDIPQEGGESVKEEPEGQLSQKELRDRIKESTRSFSSSLITNKDYSDEH